jgi:hypothetical protein
MPEQKSVLDPRRFDVRPFVYGVLDLAFAALYWVIASTIARSSTGQFQVGSMVLACAMTAAGVGTLLRRPAGWWMAVVACVTVLCGSVMLITLLALSASFLHGVYGSMGRAAAAVTLAIGAVAVEVYVLLPAFQLRYLLSDAGRRLRAQP